MRTPAATRTKDRRSEPAWRPCCHDAPRPADLPNRSGPDPAVTHTSRPSTVAGHINLDVTQRLGQHRFRPGPVADVARVPPSRVALVIAQMLSQLLVERGLKHRLGQLLEQPTRPAWPESPTRPSSRRGRCRGWRASKELRQFGSRRERRTTAIGIRRARRVQCGCLPSFAVSLALGRGGTPSVPGGAGVPVAVRASARRSMPRRPGQRRG